MAKKNLLLPVALADTAETTQKTAAGGVSAPAVAKPYYAMPEIGKDTEALYSAATEAETAYKASYETYAQSAATLQEKEEALGIWCQMVTAAQNQFYKTGSSYDAARLDKYREQLRSLQQQFFDSQLSFNAAEEDFGAKAGSYKQAVNAYNQYTTQQQALYDDWKSTVRSDTSAVQAELDAVNEQLAQLQGKDTLGKVSHILGQAATAAMGGTPGYTPYAVDPQLDALTRKKALLEEELYYSRGFGYDALRENSDFAEKSQYKSTANGKAEKNYLTGGWKNTGYDDINYDYINRVEDAVLKGWSDDNTGNLTWTGYDRSHLQQMSDEEIKMFNYLYASQGSEAAYAYVDYLMTSLTQRQRTEKEAEMAQYAKENPLGASVGSVLLSPLKVMSYAGQIADYAQDGKIDQNAGYNKYSYTNTAIRDAVSKKVEENWGGVGSFAYQTGMSMADFLLNTAITGGNGALSMTVMGSGAAADTTIAAKDRGLNDNQAFALGTIAGLAEAVTERFSLEALLKPGMSKTALGYILKNALTEASEEGASTLINTMADIIISKDKSEWAQSIQAYKKAGKSEGEAFGLALADQAMALGLDMLGGAISGGFMGTGGAVINHGSAVQTGKVIGAANPDMAQIQDLIMEGLSNDPSTRSNYLAQQYMQKLQQGEKLSNTDLGKLYQANQQVDDRHRGTNAEAAQKMLDEAAQKMAESQAVGNDAVQAEDLQQQAQRLSEVLGREIVLYSEDAKENGIRNGYYEDGKIHVNTKSKDPFAQIVSHELTHSVEFADVYDELSQVVLGRIAASGTDLAQLRRQTAALYAANDAVLRDSSEIDKEIVADYVAKQLLTDEKSIVELTREKPNLGRRILNWLNNLLAKLGNKNAQERAFLSKAKDLYAKALGQSQVGFTEDTRKTTPVVEDTGNQVPTNPELAEMLAWAREQYANGELTEEEFDSILDFIMESEERNNAAEPPEVKHSISSLPDGNKYVKADRQVIFGDDPDSWSIQVEDYINGRIRRGQDVTLIAEDGDALTITATTAGKLADNHTSRGTTLSDEEFLLKANAAVHIDELAEVSKAVPGVTRKDVGGRHGEFASGGWTYRTAFFMDFDGKYYRLRISAAKNPDGTILYNIGDVEERSFPTIDGSSSEGGALGGKTSFEKSVPQPKPAVKRQNSISSGTVRKQDVVSDLRAILNRGGGAAELRQYIAQMEQGVPEVHQNTGFAEQEYEETDQTAAEAEQIVSAARSQGVSVSEYLQQNWEQYDVDGQWNEAARKALEMGRGRRQYSVGANENTAENDTAQRKIYPGMDDTQRVTILVQKEIHVPSYDSSNPVTGAQIIRLKGKYVTEARTLLSELARQCGDFRSDLHNADIDLSFAYSNKSLKESVNKQSKRGGGAEVFGKMLTVLPQICENAVEIEAHTDRYKGTVREDSDLKEMHVLLGAFFDGDTAIPVQLEIKEYYPEARQKNKLYVTVTIKNEAGVTPRGPAANVASGNVRSRPASVITVADLISNVKDETGGLVKYIPDQMLNDEQREAKEKALAEDAARLGDMRYEYAVEQGNQEAVDRILQEKATKAGYSAGDDWRMAHRAPNREQGVTLDRADEVYGGDGSIYSPLAHQYYGEGRDYDIKAIVAINKAWRDPNGSIVVYRAVPANVRDTKLRNGDWVTPTKEYAQEHGERTFDNGFRVIEQKVPVKHLYLNGDSIHEFGYDNGRNTEVYQNTENNVKLAEVTYDDDGNLIPLSQRFDVRKNDIRYSISGNPEMEVEDADAEQTEIDGAKLRGQMPAKARDYLKGAERKMLNDLAAKLCVPYSAKREYLLPIVEEISSEYLQNGMVSEQAAERLFNKAYEQGMVVDTEYYDRYKDVKDHLRTVAVTLSTADQADIADFGDFRKRARGLLRIVNQGGMPVDSYYRELREMAPELFPDYITHPADQLQKMYKVAGDIRRVEKTLREYYGKEEASFRRWAKNDFNTAVADFASELQTVKRYAEEKTAEKEARAPLTQKEAMDEYAKLKEARRSYEKVAAKNLLTEHDEAILGDLLAGKRTLESLDAEEDNVKGITAVYEAKRELAQHMQLIAQYKRSLHKQHRDLADKHLETANEWKDKAMGIAYSRETMRRNVQDIVKDSKVAAEVNKTFFEPVAMAEAAATRFKEQYRSKVRELNLSRKVLKGNAVSEAHAVQLLGEAMDNIAMIERARGRMKTRDGKTLTEWQAVITNLWQESPKLDKQKIEGAVEAFRKIYDELFVRMNEVRVANGYEPVNYRKGYFPHFQPGASDGILAHFGKALGISTDVVALPTTINGLTHTFKPGIQWFGNAQERLGFNTAYDAVEGFDKYIEGVASVIHQTENIQRLRALATQIRYRTSDDGLREQVDKIRARDDLTEEQREALVTDLYSKGRFTLSNFVVELDEYTNLLANKKSKLDRTVEAMMGRRIYTFMKWWEGRVGANMIAGNLSSALTNFIPLTQAGAQLDRGALVKGMLETLRSIKQSDLLVERSDFITNRRGSDPLVKTWVQKASGVAGKPMELIDSFVSESIVRAAYHQNVKRGMTEEDAMHYADVFAANVMADRSKGAMPTLFESHNPLFKAFTQFQLEVNNQFSEVFKDLPRGFKEKGLKTLAWVLFKYFVGAWLYNEVFERLFGRRSALDPLGILNETVGDFSGYELPNLLELVGGAVYGDMPSFETERLGLGEAIGNLGNNLLSELPFSAGLTLIGVETDGGRIPASSAIPDLTALKDALFNTEWSAEKRWKEAADEIAKPLTYIIPPFGGNQLSKAWKGLSAYFAGGSYTVDKDGNDILQYPIFKDGEKDSFLDAIKAGIMGKSSMPEAKKWVDSGFDSFSAKQTTVYQDLLAAGVKDRDAYSLLRELEGAAKTETMSKYQAQRKILDGSAISDEGKAIVFYGLVATESDRELMDKLADLGADSAETGKVAMGLRDTNELKGVEKKQARSDLLIDSGLTDEEKTAVMETILGSELLNENGNPTQYAKLLCAVETGLPVDSYLKLYGVGADMDKYFDFVDAGLDPEDAVEATFAFAELEPEEGKEQVANIQRWEMCVEAFEDVRDQLLALRGTMTDPQYEKAEIASNYGVSPRAYVKFLRSMTKYDADGNGKYTQAEVKVAVDAMGGASRQKAVLWQLITGSTSAKNNPYSVEIGQRIIDARNGDEAAKDGLTFSELIMQQILESRK